ncbi:hypothetical protein HCJ39_06855 [Listeria rocourtiae]|uniref:CYTH domain-containing protein n=1 Tax=Listeria rocourtiae TaxID=647910 RepID=UPI001629F4A8|nr:CYTH domain-containing protein [Listeria rocourtiae]MBC1604429.1 hypothetical protein [Listeria rocourtiae]
MAFEIERKYLCHDFHLNQKSEFSIISETTIEQNYLLVGSSEMRIRKKSTTTEDSTYLTIKKGGGLIREETELLLPQDLYDYLNRYDNKSPILKNRVIFIFEGNEYSFDQYKGIDLQIIEIEFATEKEAMEFIPPDWLGKDVTDDASYKNQNLWLHLNSQ